MAKAILEYDLNDPDDKMAHFRAVKSVDMASMLFQLVYNEKKSIKNSIEFSDEKISEFEAVDMVFKRIHELLEEHGINIDELIY